MSGASGIAKPARRFLARVSVVGYLNYAAGFDRVDAYATAGGNDRAYLFDSTLDNYLEAVGSIASLHLAASAVSASDFGWVQAISNAGGNDTKRIETVDFVLDLLGL